MQTQTSPSQEFAERSIRTMEAELIQFSVRFISDTDARRSYQTQTQQYAEQMLEHLRRGEISCEQVARLANETSEESRALSELTASFSAGA